MNFVKRRFSAAHIDSGVFGMKLASILTCLVFCLSGCSDDIRLPTAEQLAEFEAAGPVQPKVDVDRLAKAKIRGGAYHVLSGEVLELTMPSILQVVTAEEAAGSAGIAPFTCRISDSGTITLPVVGELDVAGKTLAQIEAAITDAYYPEYTVTRPSVYAKIIEYEQARVSITGAVTNPGVYPLRSDQMSLVSLLMEAGGIVEDGSGAIRIIRDNGDSACGEDDAKATVAAPVVAAMVGVVESSEAPAIADDPADMVELQLPGVEPTETIDVEFEFELLSAEDTIGELFIEHEDTCIKIDSFDFDSSQQREALVATLAKDNREFAAVVNRLLKNVTRVLDVEADEPEAIPGVLNGQPRTATADAKYATTDHKHAADEPCTIVLPVEGLNTPFVDVALEDGDTVVVERLEQPLFTVMGLVAKGGNFPYPSHARYNLVQALGFSGGLDPTAEPRYATIYRLKPDGAVVNASFQIVRNKKGAMLTDSLSVPIKPGDIIAVEHTPRTRTNVFLERVFRVNLGVYAPLYDLTGN